jgi:hypothetical protein
MTGNAAFSSPDIALSQLTALIDTLESTYQDSLDGSKTKKAEALKAEAALDEALRTQARYVDKVAAGNDALILSSGFQPGKSEVTSAEAPKMIENIQATTDDIKGHLTISSNGDSNAKAYATIVTDTESVIITSLENGLEINVNGVKTTVYLQTGRQLEINGLHGTDKVHIQMLAFNSAGTSPLSTRQTFKVL